MELKSNIYSLINDINDEELKLLLEKRYIIKYSF